MLKRVLTLSLRSLTLASCVVFGAGAAVAQESVYVLNTGDATTSKINPATNTQVSVTPVLPDPYDTAVSPDGRRLYVTNATDLAVVATASNSVEGTLPIPLGGGPIVVNPNGKFAYVLAAFNSNLTVFSTGQVPRISQQFAFNGIATDMAISPDGDLLYFTDVANGSLKIMSTSNYRTLDIPLPSPFLEAVAAHPDGAHVYVSDSVADAVFVFDIRTRALTTIPVSNPTRLAVSPDGATLYVSNTSDDTVTAIATATNTIVATIPVGDAPIGIAVAATGGYVYVANVESDTTSVINTATNTVTATIPVGDAPTRVEYVVQLGPASRFSCMGGGWQTFTNPSFRNEGECIAFYNSIH